MALSFKVQAQTPALIKLASVVLAQLGIRLGELAARRCASDPAGYLCHEKCVFMHLRAKEVVDVLLKVAIGVTSTT